MLNKKERNIFVDIFKYFLALLVVNLHCGEATYQVYSNLAVPAFFMLSGYFLYKKDASHKEETDYALTYFVRAVTYCLGAFLIEIMAEVTFLRVFWNSNLSDYFYSLYKFNLVTDVLLLNHPIFQFGYHLWFLMALLDIGIVHYLLVRFNKTHWYVWLAPALLGISYFFGPMVGKLYGGNTLTEAYRNGLLWGVPYAGIGYYMAKFRNNDEKWFVKYIFLVVGVGAFVAIKYEAQFAAPYLSTLTCSYCLIRFLTSVKSPECKYFYKYVGTQGSLYVYIAHVMVFTSYLFAHKYVWGRTMVWVTFATCFALYESAYLIVMFGKYLKRNMRKWIKRLTKQKA